MALNYTNQYIQSILSFLDYVTFDGSNNKNKLSGLDLTDINNKKLVNDKNVKSY